MVTVKIFIVVLLVLVIYLAIKNQLVYRANLKAIDKIFEDPNWQYKRNQYDPNGKYYKHVFNPFKWTFKQMFPGLE